MSKHKKGFRWWLFNHFGPHEVQNLVEHIDQITESGCSIEFTPIGEFELNIKTNVDTEKSKPLIFNTLQERTAFTSGLYYGCQLFGAEPILLDSDDFDKLEEIDNMSTTFNGTKNRLN